VNRDAAADYNSRGPSYQRARATLERRCEIPPSLDVFDHELALARCHDPDLTVEALAMQISNKYHRVNGFFPAE
jgi:hypothetical protein